MGSDSENRKGYAQTDDERQRRVVVGVALTDALWFIFDIIYVFPDHPALAIWGFFGFVAIQVVTGVFIRNVFRYGIAIGLLFIAAMVQAMLPLLPKPPPAETPTHGWLTPGNEPIPYERCGEDKERGYKAHPPDATLVFLGSVEAWWPAVMTNLRIALVSFEGKPVLSFAREGDRLSVDALVFDSDGKIIAKVDNGEFTINQNNIFTVDRPDPHKLRVIDQRNETALFVHYLNPRAIYLTGEFHGPRGEYISITDERVQQRPPNVVFANSCYGAFEMLPDFRVFGVP